MGVAEEIVEHTQKTELGIKSVECIRLKTQKILFEQFPNGFTIYQGYLLADKIIKIELDGTEKGKPIEGTIKQINSKSGVEEKKIAVTYDEREVFI